LEKKTRKLGQSEV